MIETSELYKEIRAGDHDVEKRLKINGTAYYAPNIVLNTLKTTNQLFEEQSAAAGGAVSGEISVDLCGVPSASVGKMAELRPEIRLVEIGGDERVSEWIPQGVFYVDKRQTNKATGVLSLHGYDKMLATEQWYTGSNTGTGLIDKNIVDRVCVQISVTLDEETAAFFAASGRQYRINNPRDYTCRELLQTVAAYYGGNWTMTLDGKLRLVVLGKMPPETWYLVEGAGRPITFGGDRIVLLR